MYKATPIAPMGTMEGVHMPQYMSIGGHFNNVNYNQYDKITCPDSGEPCSISKISTDLSNACNYTGTM